MRGQLGYTMAMKKQYTAEFKAQIVKEILKEEKTMTQIASEYGVHPVQLSQWKKIALDNLAAVFADERKAVKQQKAQEQKIDRLYSQVGKLSTQLEWIKKNLASTRSRNERLAMVEPENRKVPLRTQARILNVNRSSTELMKSTRLIQSTEAAESRRNFALRVGISIASMCIVAWEMDIAGICPGPNLSKRNLQHKVYPYLLRNVTPSHPNHVFGIDITYIRLKQGWMYLVAVIDWYSRYIVSWQLDQTLEMPFVLTAVKSALLQAKPEIWNSDQGSHFTSDQYTDLLKAAGVRISMNGKNRAIDNIITERFWRTLKYEEVYLHEYSSPKEARQRISQFIHHDNYKRRHQSLGYLRPADVYFREDAATQPPAAI